MSTSWKVRKDGKEHGPISSAELKRLADAGAIKPFDLVQRNGQGDWYRASVVGGLFTATPPTHPPGASVPAVEPPPASTSSAPTLPARAAGDDDEVFWKWTYVLAGVAAICFVLGVMISANVPAAAKPLIAEKRKVIAAASSNTDGRLAPFFEDKIRILEHDIGVAYEQSDVNARRVFSVFWISFGLLVSRILLRFRFFGLFDGA